MEIASLPYLSAPRHLVRCQHGIVYVWNEASHLALLGNAKIMRPTIELIDEVLRVHKHGTDRWGMQKVEVNPFIIEPGKSIYWWAFEVIPFRHDSGRNGLIPTPPIWLNLMRPVLLAAAGHIETSPNENRLFLPDSNPQGWKYGVMCDE